MTDNKLISQANLVFARTTKLSDDYKILKKLGAGAFSEVFEIEDKIKGTIDCVKLIDKKSLSGYEGEDIMNEIKTLSEMDHPNIMKIKGYYETKTQMMIVSEFLSGGELFDRIVESKKFTEIKAAELMDQILSAIAYLHKRGIVHRDIKPENICFESKAENSNLKIIDFGTSKKFERGKKLKSRMGTVYYIAPEVIGGSYDFKCDVWSCGVIMYVFLFGIPPFNSKSDDEIYEKIKKGDFSFPEKIANISADAKDLIVKMLTKNPDQRITAEEALKHNWFERMRKRDKNLEHELETIKHLTNFYAGNLFQRSILLYFVSYFDLKEERATLLQVFKDLDKNHDGQLDKEEVKLAYLQLAQHPDSERVVENVFKILDVNDSKEIDFSEFLLAAADYQKLIHDKELKQIFKIIDKNGDGSLSREEIAEFFKINQLENEASLKQMISEIDKNKDGTVSYEEFVEAMISYLKH